MPRPGPTLTRFLLLVTFIALIVWWWWPSSEERAVAALIDELIAAAERQDDRTLLSHLTADYSDTFGQTPEEAVDRVIRAMERQSDTRIELTSLDVEFPDDDTARAKVKLRFSGAGLKSEDLRRLEEGRALHLTLRRMGKDWKVFRAEVRFGLF